MTNAAQTVGFSYFPIWGGGLGMGELMSTARPSVFQKIQQDFFFFGHPNVMWKFLDQRLNLRNPSCCSSNTGSLTCCATKGTPQDFFCMKHPLLCIPMQALFLWSILAGRACRAVRFGW